MKKIILASQSARRIEMMHNHGYEPDIMPAAIEENISENIKPEVAVMYLAFSKAIHVAEKACKEAEGNVPQEGMIIIAADTVVVHDDKIIGKPVDEEDAFTTLRALKNDVHHVITGVCIVDVKEDVISAEKKCFYDDTKVFFKDYSDEELRAYVRTEEPYDLAGGYAIQKTFSKYVDRIEGDYDNVVGFPWYRIEPMLKAASGREL